MKQLFTIFLFFINLFLSEKSMSQSGALDKTFGTNGITITDFYQNDDYERAMAIQSDEKILLAGYSTDSLNKSHLSVSRYYKDGYLDTLFGSKGKVFLSFFNSVYIKSIALQSDGKTILAGIGKGVFLERLNPNGSIDSSFGLNGTVQYDTSKYDDVLSIKIQKDGKVVTAGQAKSPLYPVANVFTLHRFNANGSIDSTFGTNGDIYIHLGDGNTTANDLVIQDDGKIVAGGFINIYVDNVAHAYITLIRFNTDGSLDNGFASNGIDTIFINSPYDFGVSLALQKDQKILASHFSLNNGKYSFALLKFQKDGGVDSSFGYNGLVKTSLSGNDNAFSVCIDSSGGIYQTGIAGTDIGLVKYKSSGALDSSFGNNGIVITSISNGQDIAFSVKAQQDAKILIGGYTQNDSGYDFVIARYSNEVILPVSLVNFTVKKQNSTTLLQWQTTNEINNSYFDVERSKDSKTFYSIGTKQGSNNDGINNYSFTDHAPLKGINYYRLKQIDKDGKFSLSKTVSAMFEQTKTKLYPNPSHDGKFSFELWNVYNNIKVFVTDEAGRIVYNKLFNQTNNINLQIPNNRGTYFAIIKYGDIEEKYKLVIE